MKQQLLLLFFLIAFQLCFAGNRATKSKQTAYESLNKEEATEYVDELLLAYIANDIDEIKKLFNNKNFILDLPEKYIGGIFIEAVSDDKIAMAKVFLENKQFMKRMNCDWSAVAYERAKTDQMYKLLQTYGLKK